VAASGTLLATGKESAGRSLFRLQLPSPVPENDFVKRSRFIENAGASPFSRFGTEKKKSLNPSKARSVPRAFQNPSTSPFPYLGRREQRLKWIS
jgi:hypothetical protein